MNKIITYILLLSTVKMPNIIYSMEKPSEKIPNNQQIQVSNKSMQKMSQAKRIELCKELLLLENSFPKSHDITELTKAILISKRLVSTGPVSANLKKRNANLMKQLESVLGGPEEVNKHLENYLGKGIDNNQSEEPNNLTRSLLTHAINQSEEKKEHNEKSQSLLEEEKTKTNLALQEIETEMQKTAKKLEELKTEKELTQQEKEKAEKAIQLLAIANNVLEDAKEKNIEILHNKQEEIVQKINALTKQIAQDNIQLGHIDIELSNKTTNAPRLHERKNTVTERIQERQKKITQLEQEKTKIRHSIKTIEEKSMSWSTYLWTLGGRWK